MSGAHEILQGVQFLLSKWECNELPADTVLALIEVHLERELASAPPITKVGLLATDGAKGPYIITGVTEESVELAGSLNIPMGVFEVEWRTSPA